MARRKPVRVVVDAQGRLAAIYWCGLHRVRAELDRWREGGRWWLGEEEEIEVVRVETDRGVLEVIRHPDGQWELDRVYD